MQNKIRKILQKFKSIKLFKKKKKTEVPLEEELNLQTESTNESESSGTAPSIPSIPSVNETEQAPPATPEATGEVPGPPPSIPPTPSEPESPIFDQVDSEDLTPIPMEEDIREEKPKSKFKPGNIIGKAKAFFQNLKKPKLPQSPKDKTATVSTIFTKAQRYVYAVDFKEFFNRLINERRITTTHGSISFEQLLDKIFNENKRSEFHYYFLITFFITFAFLLGSMLSSILSSSASYKNLVSDNVPKLNFNKLAKGSDLKLVKDKKMFQTGAVKKATKPKENVNKGPVICTEESSKKSSSLPITLLNTIVLQDSVKSIASVQVRSELFDLREGEQIENMAKIDRITRLKLIIKNLNSGECENVMASEAKEMMNLQTNINVMSPAASKQFKKQQKKIEGIKNDGNKFEISKSLLKSKMSNMSEILTQAQGIPITNPDGSMSFKIVNIEPGSIYTYLGIQDNDVITQINGNKINNLNEVMNLFGRIQNIDSLNLMIERNGVQTPLDYELK